MAVTSERTRITTIGASVVFMPERVALEEGLFDKHGLDVVTLQPWAVPDNVVPDSEDRDPFGNFTNGQFDAWNLCECCSVYRVEKAEGRGGRIAYLRPAVVALAIITFDPELQEPHDLAGVPVGTLLTTGGHYTALQILEGALRRDQIQVVNLPQGDPPSPIDQLKAGLVRATTVIEPFISLALREGAHIVAQSFYRGAQVFAESVPVEAQQAYVAAVNEAVDLINADPDKYRSYVSDFSGDDLAAEDVNTDYYRFTHAKEFSPERFDDTYRWMESWGLAKGDKAFDQVINASVFS